MKIELTRFRVRAGQEARVDEWMRFLNDHPAALRETLEPERMYVESIFSEIVDGVQYLYWYSVQGEDSHSDGAPADGRRAGVARAACPYG